VTSNGMKIYLASPLFSESERETLDFGIRFLNLRTFIFHRRMAGSFSILFRPACRQLKPKPVACGAVSRQAAGGYCRYAYLDQMSKIPSPTAQSRLKDLQRPASCPLGSEDADKVPRHQRYGKPLSRSQNTGVSPAQSFVHKGCGFHCIPPPQAVLRETKRL
jgi:hypothetical protein